MTDAAARSTAVDIARSVIVQAPAGSGKTTLLVERFLRLLATVDAPEAIVAITFTRKAAGEMRERILKFLEPGYVPASHELGAGEAAGALYGKLAEWQLLANPQRLIIRTIDSFNHYLARSMPVATMLGPVPAPTDDATRLYRTAARRVLRLVGAQDEVARHVEVLLVWLDQDSQRAENILTDVLASREQWLRALGPERSLNREQAESLLEAIVEPVIQQADATLRSALHRAGVTPAELVELLNRSFENMAEGGYTLPQVSAFDSHLPDADVEHLTGWSVLADRFLTAKTGPTTTGARRSTRALAGWPARKRKLVSKASWIRSLRTRAPRRLSLI